MQKPLLFFLLISVTAFSQDASLDYSKRISIDSLRNFVFILSSDSMAGRETGKPGQKMAADFLASKYSSWGLIPAGFLHNSLRVIPEEEEYSKNPYFQNHPINIRTNKGRNLSVAGENFLFGNDFVYPDIFKDTAFFQNDFLFIGAGKKYVPVPALSSTKHKSRYVLYYNEDNEELQKHIFDSYSTGNAPELIFVITTKEKIRERLTSGFSEKQTLFAPVIFITDSVAMKFFSPDKYKKLVNKIKRSEKVLVRPVTATVSAGLVSSTNALRGQNVIAFIEGASKKNETIVISSHYDHLGIRDTNIYYGADDNASGTSAVIEMARIFKMAEKESVRPKRNILFLNVSGEEKGLLGSKWYVSDPAVSMSETIANLNIDMIGRIDTHNDTLGVRDYVYIIGSDKLSTDLHNINEDQNKKGPGLELNYKFNNKEDPNRFYQRSDHYNFVKKGVPVIFYFDGIHPDYHKPTDTPDKIDFELLTKRTRLIFLTAWELANRDERIVVDKNNEDAE